MLEMEYLERMERELLEQQLEEDYWEECAIIAWPWEDYDYAA